MLCGVAKVDTLSLGRRGIFKRSSQTLHFFGLYADIGMFRRLRSILFRMSGPRNEERWHERFDQGRCRSSFGSFDSISCCMLETGTCRKLLGKKEDLEGGFLYVLVIVV